MVWWPRLPKVLRPGEIGSGVECQRARRAIDVRFEIERMGELDAVRGVDGTGSAITPV